LLGRGGTNVVATVIGLVPIPVVRKGRWHNSNSLGDFLM
jgi:hypothetical protein